MALRQNTRFARSKHSTTRRSNSEPQVRSPNNRRAIRRFFGILCPNSTNPSALEELGQHEKVAQRHSESYLRLFFEIAKLLNENGISTPPFKGATFAISVYGDLAKRQCGDLDLLVHTRVFLRTKALLIRAGYHEIYFGHAEVATVQSTLLREDKKAIINLHYALTPHFQHTNPDEGKDRSRFPQQKRNKLATNNTYWHFFLDMEPMWDRTETLEIEGTTVPVLSPEDTLLTLCSHGMKDNWRFLRLICDIAELARARPDLDWRGVCDHAFELRCGRKFLLGLIMAHDFLGMPLPNELMPDLKPSRGLYFLSKKYRKANFSKVPTTDQGLDWKLYASNRRSHYNCANLLTMDTLSDAVRYFFYLVRRLGVRDPNNHP
ncbi:MAG: nucleotidyltransferase family protein, partial [Gammaproteobacteria bacterium]|nr:nucleotidyltransferase family protein [Gammaproteobacteria bacterium]